MYLKYIVSEIQDFLKAQVRFSKIQTISFICSFLKSSYSDLKSSAKSEFINLKTDYDIAEAVT